MQDLPQAQLLLLNGSRWEPHKLHAQGRRLLNGRWWIQHATDPLTCGACRTNSPMEGSRLQVQSISQSACSVWSCRGQPAGRMQPGGSRPLLSGYTERAAPVSSSASSSSTWLPGHCRGQEQQKSQELSLTAASHLSYFLWAVQGHYLPYQSPVFNIILGSEVNDHRRPKLVDALKEEKVFYSDLSK